MRRPPKRFLPSEIITGMNMSPAEVYAMAEMMALQDAFVLLFGALMSEWPDEKFQQFADALQAPRPHGLESITPAAVADIVSGQFEGSRSRLAKRLGEQRAMLIEALAQHLDS